MPSVLRVGYLLIRLVLEPPGPPPAPSFLLLEDGSFLLLEDGSKIILE